MSYRADPPSLVDYYLCIGKEFVASLLVPLGAPTEFVTTRAGVGSDRIGSEW